MKLLIGGKPRNIYFRKNNTAYYKSNGNENDITHYFKKKGDLKKQYSNLLVENNKVLKNRKIIIGGGSSDIPIFNNITILLPVDAGNEWTDEENLLVYRGLVQLCLLTKIECDNNDGKVKMLTDLNMPKINKDRFITLLEIIFGCYKNKNTDMNLKLQPPTVGDISIQAIANFDGSSLFNEIKENYSNEKIKTLFNKITYNTIVVILDMISNLINSQEQKMVKRLVSNLSKLKALMVDAGFLANPDDPFWVPYPQKNEVVELTKEPPKEEIEEDIEEDVKNKREA
jgi:hypothetical protein